MEPLSPNDPLWDVLGKAKPVKPRPNFAQNVVRQARQTPQERGWLAQLKGWWLESGTAKSGFTWAATAAAIALAATTALVSPGPQEGSPSLAAVSAASVSSPETGDAEFPLVPEFETEWKNLEQVGDLLAVNDTSLLTDSEINLLLY
ncbi:MAG TPA: hypothetical protein VGE29_00920 [Prosthecobacter sp.]